MTKQKIFDINIKQFIYFNYKKKIILTIKILI